MENVYMCSCGNAMWVVLDNGIRCAACNRVFDAPHLPVREFNRVVLEELKEEEECNLEVDVANLPVRDFDELVLKELKEEELASSPR